MRALVLEGIGELVLREVPLPEPKAGEVLLKIGACGICSSDIDRVFRTGTYHFPTIPGHEFAGEIVALGEGCDVGLLHRKAAVFPLLPCGQCPSCQKEAYARCDHYNYFGSRCDGAFAEYLAVPVWNLVLLEEHVSLEEGALLEPASVALHSVERSGMKRGDTVAVIGIGTIGLLTAMWCRNRGASRVVLLGRTAEKVEFAKKLGFEAVSNREPEQADREIVQLLEGAPDVVFECVGGEASLSQAIGLAAKGGTVVVTGNPPGDISLSRAVYWKILRNELSVVGTWNSDYQSTHNNWREAAEALANGSLPAGKLITSRYTLEQSEEAFGSLMGKKKGAFQIKVMFTMGESQR